MFASGPRSALWSRAPFDSIETSVSTGANLAEVFGRINPKQRVPVLALDGDIITELPAVATAIANMAPERHLMGGSLSAIFCLYADDFRTRFCQVGAARGERFKRRCDRRLLAVAAGTGSFDRCVPMPIQRVAPSAKRDDRGTWRAALAW